VRKRAATAGLHT